MPEAGGITTIKPTKTHNDCKREGKITELINESINESINLINQTN